jgi:glycine cleavage system H protein
MKTLKATRTDLYYTNDHEWINYQGSVAYVGVCPFKLKGLARIERLTFEEENWFKKQGEVIATLYYDDRIIPVCMPVDGKIINLNDKLMMGHNEVLLQSPDNEGWIALISPAQPYERKGLLQCEQYKSLLRK